MNSPSVVLSDEQIEAERATFEAWADDQGFPLRKLESSDGESYEDLRTQGPWEAWQARAILAASSVGAASVVPQEGVREPANTLVAERLIELAYALNDDRLPMAARVAYVQRELAFAAKELLASASVVPQEGVSEQLAVVGAFSIDARGEFCFHQGTTDLKSLCDSLDDGVTGGPYRAVLAYAPTTAPIPGAAK